MVTTNTVKKAPREIADLRQWVGWNFGETRDNGSRDKIPVCAVKGRTVNARVNDENTWTSYQEAIANAERFGWDGVGFVVTENDDIVGIDIDKCFIDNNLNPQAEELIELLNSYTEISPSGTGIRILVRGKLPEGTRNRLNGLEVYASKRFLTITGNTIRDLPVERRQEELDKVCLKYLGQKQQPAVHASPRPTPAETVLSDNEIIELLLREGGKARQLLSGDISDYPSHSEADQALVNKITFYSKDPQQIDRVFRQSGLYRDKWDSREDYRKRTIENALTLVREQYTGTNRQERNRRQEQPQPQTQPQAEIVIAGRELNEYGDACRVADRHGGDILYNEDRGIWYRWRGNGWEPVTDSEIANLIIETNEHLKNNPGVDDADIREKIRKHAKKCQSKTRVQNISALLKGIAVDTPEIAPHLTRNRRKGIPIYDNVLDTNRDVIGTPAGPIDLRTGEPMNADRNMLITLSTSVEPAPRGTPCPLWNDLIDHITKLPNNDEYKDWIHKMSGYLITGWGLEQVFFILYGSGLNGKSTYIKAIADILGEYASYISQTTLMSSPNAKGGESRPDLVRMRGSRFIPSVETPEYGKLNENMVKALTGGDYIVARGLYENEIQFECTGKLAIATNNKPTIREMSEAMWRRVRLIPFTNKLTTPDHRFGEKLVEEYPAIFRWLIDGAMRWYQDGLGNHPIVQTATQEYQDEIDPFISFFENRCDIDPKQEDWFETINGLYNSYVEFCEASGDKPLSKIALGRYISSKFNVPVSIKKIGRETHRGRNGIRLKELT